VQYFSIFYTRWGFGTDSTSCINLPQVGQDWWEKFIHYLNQPPASFTELMGINYS
jgi:hypothetical protein